MDRLRCHRMRPTGKVMTTAPASGVLRRPDRLTPRLVDVTTLDTVPSPALGHTHNVRAVLRQRGFRRLLGVRLASHLGDGWFQAGLAGSVLFNPDKQASPFDIAVGFALLLLPYSLVGPYIGVFLDRWSRRSILFVANMLRAILVVPAALLIFSGSEGLPFLVSAFLIIGLNRFFLAGVSASIPHVVDDRRLVTANSMATTLGSITFAVGLASAVGLIKFLAPTYHSYGGIAAFAMVGYAVSAITARMWFGPADLGPDGPPRSDLRRALAESGRGMIAGVRHLAERRGAAYALLAQSAQRFLLGILTMSTLLLFRGPFATGDKVTGSEVSGSAIGLAAVLAAGGVGALLASMLTPPLARRMGGWRWVTLLLGAEGVAVGVFGPPFEPVLLVVAVLAVNLAGQGVKIVVDTDLQHECDDSFRGRVFSLADTTFNVSIVGGLFAAALVLPEDGRSGLVLLIVAVALAFVALWYALVGGRWAQRVGDDIQAPKGQLVGVASGRLPGPPATETLP
jgi:hypothetical protein